MPADWYSAPSLNSMYLNGNKLSGQISAPSDVAASWAAQEIAGLTDAVVMKRMSLASNMLTGTIPAGLWRYRMQACYGTDVSAVVPNFDMHV